MGGYRLGVDIGGTFTDLVMLDEATGELRQVKLPSTPRDPSIGFTDVLNRALKESGSSARAITCLIHGTTVATNTIIEGKGAHAALITTEGFRDVLEIARQIRPRLYDIFCEKPKPLIPRYLCYGVPERIDYAGQVVRPLDEDAVREVVRAIRKENVEAVAVCLLHSYVNPAHERRVGAVIAEELPAVFVSLSSELCPEMREYFRASTTVINAVEMPIVSRYLDLLENRLSGIGVETDLNLMASAGGIISSQVARREPVHLVESGPAAGVIAATHLGMLVGVRNLIGFDMGGTTAKASLVENGVPKVAGHFEVGSHAVAESRGAGYPVRTPVLDLVEIGAGGGSIAWVDPGGGLRVGPQSAGADPGPACYGRGGDQPTITDANLLLGRLNPGYFLGGEFPLYPELAEKAVGQLAERLGLSPQEAANGIIEIANSNMVGALRLVSVQRGFDPREFMLVAFGGAGPVHANALARDLSISKVLIPMGPGVTTALGLLVSDIKHDYVRGYIRPTATLDFAHVNRLFEEMEGQGGKVLAAEGINGNAMRFTRYVDMRYVGQSYELMIEARNGELEPADIGRLNQAFFRQHERAYGYAVTTEPTEVVNLRVTATGLITRPQLRRVPAGDADSSAAIKGKREVYFSEAGRRASCKVYDRYKLRAGNWIDGPAIIEEADSTVVIHPGFGAGVDAYGNILIQE